jgi:hypothetical protein
VDPKAGLDDENKRKFFILPGHELQPLGRAARSQSLYRLCYPGSDGRMINDELAGRVRKQSWPISTSYSDIHMEMQT